MQQIVEDQCRRALFHEQIALLVTETSETTSDKDAVYWRNVVVALVYAVQHVHVTGSDAWFNVAAAQSADYQLIGRLFSDEAMTPALELMVLASVSERDADLVTADTASKAIAKHKHDARALLVLDARSVEALAVMQTFSLMTLYGNRPWPDTTREELTAVRSVDAKTALLFALDAASLQLFMRRREYSTAYGAVSAAVKKTAAPGTKQLLHEYLSPIGVAKVLANELRSLSSSLSSSMTAAFDVILRQTSQSRLQALQARLLPRPCACAGEPCHCTTSGAAPQGPAASLQPSRQ